jgi:hypothetical protein
MSRYEIRTSEGPGQPGYSWTSANKRRAIASCRESVASGFVHSHSGEVIDRITGETIGSWVNVAGQAVKVNP